jgi:hypothetical protein
VVAVDILEVGAISATDEERLVQPDRTHRANGRVDAAGDEVERAAVQLAAHPYNQFASSLVQ